MDLELILFISLSFFLLTASFTLLCLGIRIIKRD